MSPVRGVGRCAGRQLDFALLVTKVEQPGGAGVAARCPRLAHRQRHRCGLNADHQSLMSPRRHPEDMRPLVAPTASCPEARAHVAAGNAAEAAAVCVFAVGLGVRVHRVQLDLVASGLAGCRPNCPWRWLPHPLAPGWDTAHTTPGRTARATNICPGIGRVCGRFEVLSGRPRATVARRSD